MSENATDRHINDMQRALKVIYTWASFDYDCHINTEGHALDNKHVMDLCEKALNSKEAACAVE